MNYEHFIGHAHDTVAAPATARRARVLVAEDDPELRQLVVVGLIKDGYHVEEVATGYDLLLFASRPNITGVGFDLIISDIRMPGLDALEVIAGLRSPERPGRWSTPIFLMTAFGDAETRAEATRLGVRLFDKPFDVDDLRTCAINLVRPLLPTGAG